MPLCGVVLLVVDERAQHDAACTLVHPLHKRAFVFLETEHLNQYRTFQLSHALDVERGQPGVELHEVHLVALGAQVGSQAEDEFQRYAGVDHVVDIGHDDIEDVQRLHRTVDGVALTGANLVEPALEQQVGHLGYGLLLGHILHCLLGLGNHLVGNVARGILLIVADSLERDVGDALNLRYLHEPVPLEGRHRLYFLRLSQ